MFKKLYVVGGFMGNSFFITDCISMTLLHYELSYKYYPNYPNYMKVNGG